MDEPVSAAEANRRFSVWLRGVRHGHSSLVTSHGRPVARIVPPAGATLRLTVRGTRCLLTSKARTSSRSSAGLAMSYTRMASEGRRRLTRTSWPMPKA